LSSYFVKEEVTGEEMQVSRSRIFLNKEKLSPFYVPCLLPHRELQMNALWALYGDQLNHLGGTYERVTQLIGPIGTGKTASARRFGEAFEAKAKTGKKNLSYVYLNCRLEDTSRILLYRALLEKAAPGMPVKSLGAQEMLRVLLKYLRSGDAYLLLTLDEIDYFCRNSKEHIVYDLTRLHEVFPEQLNRVIGVIFVARDESFRSYLEPSELSTIGQNRIDFPPYSTSQILDILNRRAEEALRPNAASSDVLEFISDIASRPPASGDVRYALDLLLHSGLVAEQQSGERITVEHVRAVQGQLKQVINADALRELSAHARLVLLATVKALKGDGTPYVSLQRIREGYLLLCEQFEVKPTGAVERHLQELIDSGVVEMKSLLQFGVVNIPTETLDKALATELALNCTPS
jgi:cell division control protein 6